jgi:hypothetical protein
MGELILRYALGLKYMSAVGGVVVVETPMESKVVVLP